MNNLTQTQQSAKQAYLDRQQAEMLTIYQMPIKRKETPLSNK